mgnify:CR=1 FL=1
MRVLIVGRCFGYAASGCASAHGVELRDIEIARAIARRGHDVHMVSTTVGRTDDGLFDRVPWSSVEPRKYDAIVLSEIVGHRMLSKQPRFDDAMAHPNVIGVFDGIHKDDHETEYVRAVGMTTPNGVVEYQRRHPGKDVFLLPWAMTDVPLDVRSPWPDARPRAIYLGIVNDRFLDAMGKLAAAGDVEVWIAALFLVDGRFGGVDDACRAAQVHPGIRFLSDVIPQGSAAHGPVRCGAAHAHLAHADVGLNFTLSSSTNVINCKLADYLGAGMRVVSEEGAVNNGDVVTLRAGRIVPWNDPATFCRAVAEEACVKHDRRNAAARARALCSWSDVAGRILEHAR